MKIAGAGGVSTDLELDAICSELAGAHVGRHIRLYDVVDSTNVELARLARAGVPDGTVVIADAQTAGRGRHGAAWFSPPGVNLHLSALFRRPFPAREVPVFTFIGSLALVDALAELGLDATIKWPNDVLLKGCKVGGVLAECGFRGAVVDHVILGLGANVNVEPAALERALGPAARFATSVAAVTGHPVERSALAAAYLRYLDAHAAAYEARGVAAILAEWRDHDILGGRRIEVRAPAGAFIGRVLGVTGEGALVVRDARGVPHTVTAGEIRLAD